MNLTRNKPVESLESWLSKKPYWEQYVWRINFDKESLTDADIDQCYEYLRQHLSLIPPSPLGTKPNISFQTEAGNNPNVVDMPVDVKILEVKDFKNVNAISERC